MRLRRPPWPGRSFVIPLVFGFGLMGPFSVLVSGANARGEKLKMAAHLRRGLVISIVLGLGLALAISVLHQPPESYCISR